MNWSILGLAFGVFYLLWFAVLLYKKKYNRSLLFYALAHIPYLLVNAVAPFRGLLDTDYAGYNVGLLHLKGSLLIFLVVGALVLACFLLASKALLNQMKGWWKVAFFIDLAICILFAIPIFWDIISDLPGARLQLGEYLNVSGIWVGLVVFLILSGPMFYATWLAAKKAFKF